VRAARYLAAPDAGRLREIDALIQAGQAPSASLAAARSSRRRSSRQLKV
jgi:hypothetical protein